MKVFVNKKFQGDFCAFTSKMDIIVSFNGDIKIVPLKNAEIVCDNKKRHADTTVKKSVV